MVSLCADVTVDLLELLVGLLSLVSYVLLLLVNFPSSLQVDALYWLETYLIQHALYSRSWKQIIHLLERIRIYLSALSGQFLEGTWLVQLLSVQNYTIHQHSYLPA